MAEAEAMSQPDTQADKAIVKTMSEAVEDIRRPIASTGHVSTAESMGPRGGRLTLNELSPSWVIKDKYSEHKTFEMEVIWAFMLLIIIS